MMIFIILLNALSISNRVNNSSDDRYIILEHIWNRVKLGKTEWRKVYKALYLLLIILKAGDPLCFPAIKGKWYAINSLKSYRYTVGNGNNWNIQEKAKEICELINNEELLENERKKTNELRIRLGGTCIFIIEIGKKYGGISSTSYGTSYHLVKQYTNEKPIKSHSEKKHKKKKSHKNKRKSDKELEISKKVDLLEFDDTNFNKNEELPKDIFESINFDMSQMTIPAQTSKILNIVELENIPKIITKKADIAKPKEQTLLDDVGKIIDINKLMENAPNKHAVLDNIAGKYLDDN